MQLFSVVNLLVYILLGLDIDGREGRLLDGTVVSKVDRYSGIDRARETKGRSTPPTIFELLVKHGVM